MFDSTTLIQILRDLCGPQAERLQALAMGSVGLPQLQAALQELEASEAATFDVPATVDPFRVQALAADYKLQARSLDLTLQLLDSDPSMAPAIQQAARRVRDRILDGRMDARTSAARLVGHSEKVRQRMEVLADDVAPLPTSLGFDWAHRLEAWLAVGDELTALLRSPQAPGARQAANGVRMQATAVLHRVRRAVLAELELDPDQPAGLAATIFARYDEARSLQSRGGRRRVASTVEPHASGSPESTAANEPSPQLPTSSIAEAAEELADAAEELADAAEALDAA